MMHCMNNDADAAHVYFRARLHGCFNKCTGLLPWSTTSHHNEAWSSCCRQTILGDLNHTECWMSLLLFWMCGRHVSLTPEQLRYDNLVKNLGVITVGCDEGLKLQSTDYDKQQRRIVMLLSCTAMGRKTLATYWWKYVDCIVFVNLLI